ncbi:esterase-like activity of phytase family protein [Okeania sp.]|uniref:esterase-like activity of phytase family protein n=1 Tax=Okeania sp. TaxID=3100323 RepID=UPI002B4AF37B|nr:esterase-like activity of phytase family protein [Okeania sp.]MEB3342728.1 esterase-like activity of phytase family protein [Okeania sp.]
MPELVGFAVLPADTFAEGPSSGNFIETDNREVPFDDQPVQGFSAVQFAPDSEDGSTFWFLSDNGFGAQSNSPDYLLRLYQVDPDFAGTEDGDTSVEIQGFVQLADPNNLIPFDIINETGDRFLTGADFDIESFVIANNGDIWIGEEFGPYILHFDSEGTLLEAPIATPNPEFQFNTLNGQVPLVVGHRGASGELPEHTLEAYQLAIEQGADFIEPDLVTTSDGFLIARHEPLLDDTTNVAEVFGPERQSTKNLDGAETTGYFAEDFTLEEIKQLRAVQPRDFRDQSFNGQFEIPTLEEIIELVQTAEADTGVEVGIYPETKHPTFFDLQDLSLEEPLIQTLQDTGFTDPDRIFIQSFEIENLLDLQNNIMPEAGIDIPLVQLFGDVEGAFINDNGGGFSVPYDIVYNFSDDENADPSIYDGFPIEFTAETNYGDLANANVIDYIGENYAEGLGPWKNSFVLRESLDEPVDGNGDGVAEIGSQLTGEIRPYIEWAHDAGMQIHPYTLRNEERYLVLDESGNPQTPEAEFEQLINLGVDGFFTDFPETGRNVVDQITSDEVRSPQNPNVEAGKSNLSGSRGYEGMAFSPDRETFYPLLEGAVVGDPNNALRLYEFEPASSSFNNLIGFYPTDVAGHPIGDFTPINNTEFLVIERDNNQGEDAGFKKIFKIDISDIDAQGFVAKEEVVDLLNIPDPDDLNGDGENTFTFPFVTIEDVLVLDEDTILVANDNNYPFSIGRGPDIDNNEIIQIDLDEPLNLDPRLGVAAGEVFEGTDDAERLNGTGENDLIKGFDGNDTLVGGAGNDQIIGNRGSDSLYGKNGNDELQGRQGNDRLFGGAGNDMLKGGQGRDRINGGAGDDTLTGGASIDRFIFNSNDEFNVDDFGVDTINDFRDNDLILLDKSTFTGLDSDAGIGFSVNSDFDIVNNNGAVGGSDAAIVYSQVSGGLFYNVGGDPTRFVTLAGAPTITEDNFQIRN